MNSTNKFTSARLYSLLFSTRKARIVTASAVVLTVFAFGAAGVAPLAPDAANIPVRSIAEDCGVVPTDCPKPERFLLSSRLDSKCMRTTLDFFCETVAEPQLRYQWAVLPLGP